jgi:hypothetical protein
VAWPEGAARRIVGSMGKRIAAGVLWLLAGWYLGNILAYHAGWNMLFGPVLGIAAAAIVAGDPFGLLWRRAAGPSPGDGASGQPTVDGATTLAD